MQRWLLLIGFLLSSCTPSTSTESNNSFDRSQNFIVGNSTDPITGEDTSVAYVKELSPTPDRSASMAWGCQDGYLRVIIRPDENLGISEAQVQYRLDDIEPITDKGWQVTDVIFFPPITGLDFTTVVLGFSVERFAFRVIDINGKPHTYLFNLNGVQSALRQLPCAEAFFR